MIFLAIDPRIVVPAIEMDNSGFYDGAGINGYDYLAKIVSFPFSFPVMRDEEKKMLCRGFSVGRGDFFKTEWMDWKDKINDKMNRIESENHYHMTTTSGGAARVMSWLEEFLQTEWLDMKVYCTSVTEQWTVLSICGPKSRELLASGSTY